MPTFDRDRVRAICFDLDGTLVDTDDSYVLSIARLLKHVRGLLPENDETAAARKIVMAAETPTNALLHGLDVLHLDGLIGGLFERIHYIRGEARSGVYTPVPGSNEMLLRLNEHFPLSIVTAREERSTHTILESLGWSQLFKAIATAQTCRRGKPHPAPVEWTALHLSLDPASLLMVGDTPVDIRSGRSAGAQTAGVLSGFGTREELEESGSNLILRSASQLLDVFELA